MDFDLNPPDPALFQIFQTFRLPNGKCTVHVLEISYYGKQKNPGNLLILAFCQCPVCCTNMYEVYRYRYSKSNRKVFITAKIIVLEGLHENMN